MACGILRAKTMNPAPNFSANGFSFLRRHFFRVALGLGRKYRKLPRAPVRAAPILKKAVAQITDKNLKYDRLMSTARCAMGLEQTDTTVRALLDLNRSFPQDPEVLISRLI